MSGILKKYFQNRNKQFNMSVPSEILKVLTDDAPEGFEYKDIGKGVCLLTPSSNEDNKFGKINVTGRISVISPDAAKNIVTIKDLLLFADNTQQKVVVSAENVVLSIGNEKELSKDILVNTRGNNTKFKWHKFEIKPRKLEKKLLYLVLEMK